jgi:hypothetical protein
MISESATNESTLFTGGFVLFPSDVTKLQEYTLPSNSGIRCEPPENSNQKSFLFDVDNQQVKVYVGNIVMSKDMREYKDWWWYPNQVLLIPAYAIDIVTSPIQFLIAMNSLSKIDN